MDIVHAAGNQHQLPENYIYESRDITPVREIVVRGNVNVIFKPSSTSRMAIAGELAAGIKSVKTYTENNRLMIERADVPFPAHGISFQQSSTFSCQGAGYHVTTSQSVFFSGAESATCSVTFNGRSVGLEDPDGRIVVGIGLPCAPTISNLGSGKIILQELQQNRLDIQVAHAGVVDAMGQVGVLACRGSGQGRINALELVTDRAELDVSGMARVDARVRQRVQSNISGMGKVRIHGNPASRSDTISGMGKISYA